MEGLKPLKCPEEGEMGADHEKWSDKLEAHVLEWPVGDKVPEMISSKAPACN